MELTVLRDEESQEVTTRAAQCSTDGAYKLGAWIRDSMAGIGTLTFVDPETGLFGTLGHGINDVDTAVLMKLQSGAITPASVAGVVKGVNGRPGELRGAFSSSQDLGTLYANTESGVFGHLQDPGTFTGTPVPVATAEEVHTGQATILANVAGTEVEEYTVEILKVYSNTSDTRDLMLRVTDPRLLEKTGGIVQGMSGSPILQDGKLVGAVTHVLIDHADRGYGILAQNMLDQAAQAQNT
ncbi:MAG: SpoIVB peptidase S55 domain-containing protein [Evtepia gabavorous]